MTLSFSIDCTIDNAEEECSIDFEYADSTGISLQRKVSGDNPLELVEDLAYMVMDEILYQDQMKLDPEEGYDYFEDEDDEEVDDYVEYLLEQISNLHQENDSLKKDIDILQRRADDAVKDSNDTKKYNDGLSSLHSLNDILGTTDKKSLKDLNDLVKKFYL